MDSVERLFEFGRSPGLDRSNTAPSLRGRAASDMNWGSVYFASKNDGHTHFRFTLMRSVLIALSTTGTIRGTIRHNNTSQPFVGHPGSLFIFPAREEFDFELTTNSPYIRLYLSANILRSVADEVLPPDHGEVRLYPRFAIFDPFLERACLSIRECLADAATSSFAVEQIGRAIAGYLIQKYSDAASHDAAPAAQANAEAIVARARETIESRLDQHLTIADIAQGSGLSVYHYGRLFKEAAGMTLYQFVIRCRVERARTLLSSTGKPIVEVAHECGFADT
jgi:AraC family transcriptional regulator